MESILLSEIKPSPTSKILANNIILSLEGQPPSYASREFLEASARWLNGHELSDALGLRRPSFYYTALVAGQCIVFMSISYLYRSMKYLDQKQITTLKRLFPQLIHNPTSGLTSHTDFALQYIPEFTTKTELGEYVAGEQEASSGTERRTLRALIFACVGMVIGAWFVLRGIGGMWKGVEWLMRSAG